MFVSTMQNTTPSMGSKSQTGITVVTETNRTHERMHVNSRIFAKVVADPHQCHPPPPPRPRGGDAMLRPENPLNSLAKVTGG